MSPPNDAAPGANMDPPPPATPTKQGMSGAVKLLIGCAVLLPLLVCCVGVLSATAIPAFLRFTARSKTAEAAVNLSLIASSVRARCEQGQPGVAAGPLPAQPTPDKQLADFSADPGFAALGFTPAEALYFRYSVEPQADGTTAIRAEGDLDGDGVLSLYEVTCGTTCECSPMYTERDLE